MKGHHMARTKKQLVWTKVNPASLPASLQPRWAAVQKAQKALGEVKAAFETDFVGLLVKKGKADISGENVVRVGYNFGGLSFAQDKKSDGTSSSGGIDLDD